MCFLNTHYHQFPAGSIKMVAFECSYLMGKMTTGAKNHQVNRTILICTNQELNYLYHANLLQNGKTIVTRWLKCIEVFK